MSPCAQKVRIVLAEKGLEWTKHHVSLQTLGPDRCDIGMVMSFREMDKLAKTEIAQILIEHIQG